MNRLAFLEKAKSILYSNKGTKSYTIPSPKLYPFQWNWDSGFVALGYIHFDIGAAMQEINSLLSGQWENGMLPHILFHSETEKSYFPNWEFWDSGRNEGAPSKVKTSGITQPPVLGFVLERMLEKYPTNATVLAFAKAVFPKIVHSHRFWYKYRDPGREGLIFICHPWESGRDNSPLWDDALNRIDLSTKHIPVYKRRDTTVADSSERPTNKQYDQFIYLLELGKQYRYDGKQIAEESEFLIQDSLVNALLIKCNKSLIAVGKRLHQDIGEISEWLEQGEKSFNEKLWNASIQTYTGYDLRNQKQLPHWEIGGLTALYAHIPSPARVRDMISYVDRLRKDDFLLMPSFDVYNDMYDSKRYWRGPIWPHMNWMIYHGLKSYGYDELALRLKEDALELVYRLGFYEYFEAQRQLMQTLHSGYGGNSFSWTASTVIDLLYSA